MHEKLHAVPSCCLCSRDVPLKSWGSCCFVGKSLCHGGVTTIYDQAGATTVTLCHQGQPSLRAASRGLQRAGWTQLWMCVNVSGFVPVQRGPEQCLCIAVPTELGPSRTLSPAPEPAQMPTAQKVPSFTQEKRC